MKITPQILTAVQRAVDHYGNTSQVAKAMGVAHSTVFFWLNGKTVSMSGKSWQSKIRPVLLPFLTAESSAGTPLILQEETGRYLAKNGGCGLAANENCIPEEKAEQLPVVRFADLSKFDPSSESVRNFLKQNNIKKETYTNNTPANSFIVRLDNEFSGVFLPGTELLISTEDFPENQSIVIARIRETGEVIMGKYTRSGSRITILSLRHDGANITWDCAASLGYTLWCFHVLEAKLDLREV